MWMLWFFITTAQVCAPGAACAPPATHPRLLPTQFKTEAACAKRAQSMQLAMAGFNKPATAGQQYTTTVEFRCESVQGGK